MSGVSSLSTLLVQRLDAVLGSTVASHPHMITGVRRDAVVGPGATPRPTATEDSSRKPTPAEDAAIVLPQVAARTRLAQPALRLPLAATPDRAPSAHDSDSALDADAADLLEERTALATAGRARDLRQDIEIGAAARASARAAAPLASGTPSAPTILGQTARLINALLSDPKLDGQALRGAQPLIAAGGGSAAQLTSYLQRVIEFSGLFYERHLSYLAFGRRDLPQLRAEPQAHWSTTGEAVQNSAQTPADATLKTPGQPTSQALAQASSIDGPGAPSLNAPRQDAAPLPMAQETLMRLQLEALATQEIRWRGEAWAGVPMDWRISRDDPSAVEDPDRPWRTALILTLPRLGRVDIEMSGMGNRLSLRMLADQALTELDSHKQGLRTRLQAQGLAVDVAVVAPDLADPAVTAAPMSQDEPGTAHSSFSTQVPGDTVVSASIIARPSIASGKRA